MSFEFLTSATFEVLCLLACGGVLAGRNVSMFKTKMLSMSVGQMFGNL